MEVDVIIPSRGTPAFTEACLSSVRDGGISSVRTIEDVSGMGFAHCCNIGISESKAPWIVLMHSDCLVPHGWIDALFAAHAATGGTEEVAAIVPETCLAAGPFVVKEAKKTFLKIKKKATPSTAQDVTKIVDEALGGLDNYAKTHASNGIRPARMTSIESFCVLISMTAIQKVGLLDESFTPAGSEMDEWFMRAQRMGYECWAARGAYVHHWEGATFKALGLDRNRMLEDGRKRLNDVEDSFYGINQ